MQTPNAAPTSEMQAEEMVQILLDPTNKKHKIYLQELNKILELIGFNQIPLGNPGELLHFIHTISDTELDRNEFAHVLETEYLPQLDSVKDAERIAKIKTAIDMLKNEELTALIEAQKAAIETIIRGKNIKNAGILGGGILFLVAVLYAFGTFS